MTDAEKLSENASIDYLGVLLSRWWLVALGTIVCAVAAAGVSLLLPNEYEASIVLLAAPPQFKTELKPAILPAQTYKRILESKGLIEKVLQQMKERHSEDFSKTTVEDMLDSCRVEIEVTKSRDVETESPLLVLFARHKDPEYAKEMADIWAQEFIALTKTLQRTRTTETDQFVSGQFQETKAKLVEAEKAVTEFSDEAQVEALKQQIAGVSEQSKQLLEQLETSREELATEKGKLSTLDERISAVEVKGRWLGELLATEVDLSEMSRFQKEVATELIKMAKVYQETTERLAEQAGTTDVETLKRRIWSYRQMLIEKESRLEDLLTERKSLEAALTGLSSQLSSAEQVIILKKSLPDEVLWNRILDGLSKEDVQSLSKMHLTSEVLNPEYVLMAEQIVILREALEKAVSEEKHLAARLPQLEKEVKNLESTLRRQEKRETDLRLYHTESKKAFESHYSDYMAWLAERNTCRTKTAELERAVTLLEERHKERLSQMRLLSTDLNRKQDEQENLKRVVEATRHAYESLKNKAEEARIAVAQKTEDVRLVTPAIVPGKKVAPQRSLITIVAAIVGFLLLSLGAILFEYRAQMA